MNEADMPPEIEDEPPPDKPWWCTNEGMSRMRHLEEEIDHIDEELRNGH